MRPLAVIGPLSRDIVAGAAPRIGGAPWYAARALRLLSEDALVFAKCGENERATFQRALSSIGLPASLSHGGSTTEFSFTYDDHGVRTMYLNAAGEPWQLDEPPSGLLRRVEWLHVAPLVRSDFDAAAMERLGSGRRVSLDAQGLVRRPDVGPLQLDADFDHELLRHVSILKVSEEEAEMLTDGNRDALPELGVPEIILTLGPHGSIVYVHGRAERIPARLVETADPTGAGDSFAVAYLVARSNGHAPVSAARRATALVAALLMGTTR